MVDPPTVPVQWLWKRRPDRVGELAILTNFLWNNRWPFKRCDVRLGRVVPFNLSYLGGMAIATSITIMLVGASVPHLLADMGIASGACATSPPAHGGSGGRNREALRP
jgi:hypothetical protein